MTSIDLYQPCVCGSGKKFKFCKCGAAEHVSDVDKILRLMDGGQDLAALERINSQLQKVPNSSWLLALKAELNLSMQEFGSFVETSNRFLKLKPDNPLALIFRSIAAAIQQEPIETQCKYLLDGLAESRESISSHALFAVHSLVLRIRDSEYQGLVSMWAEMHDQATSDNPGQSVLRDPSLHLACKSASKIVHGSSSAPWHERLQEVIALSSAFRFEQAEKKLQSILRDYPLQPEPLSYLLRSQVSQLERSAAITTAKKLAEHQELTAADRAYYRVLAWEFEQVPLEMPSVIHYGEIESDEALIESLQKLDELREDTADPSRHFMASIIGDEIPAKKVYQVFRKTAQENGDVMSFVGIVAVYGRQTDKPPRALLMAPDVPADRAEIEKVSQALQLTRSLEEQPPYRQTYSEYLIRNRFADNPNAPWVTIEQRGKLLVEEFLNLPFTVLDGQTPLEAAPDERKRAILQALLLHLEGNLSIVVPRWAIEQIYQRLEIEMPAKIEAPADDSQFSITTYMDLLRLDYGALSDTLLGGITKLAADRAGSRLMWDFATELIRREVKDSVYLSLAYAVVLELDPDLGKKLDYIDKLIELNSAAGQPVGRQILMKYQLLATLQSTDRARDYLHQATKDHANDPELVAFFQQFQAMANQQRGGDEALGMRMLAGASQRQAAREESGLILPGEAQPAAGESKLWLPGT